MPELPEVETSRRQLERVLTGRRLVKAFTRADDFIVFDRQSPTAVAKALRGARVQGVQRRGKYLWLELDRKPWPVLHLGMTGNVEIRSAHEKFKKAWGGLKLWREPATKKELSPFWRLRLQTDDGDEVAISDPRRFGRIRLADSPADEPPISRLGRDPLADFYRISELEKILARRKAPIKNVLLDQKIFAGVGNWIADEVLFQSGISPHRLANTLSPTQVKNLRTKLLAIIRKAVAVDADYDRYPKNWLFHYRWGREKNSTIPNGYRVFHDTLGGRTAAWVPGIQT